MEPRESLLASYDADVFLTSANAISNDGILVNIDGNSNRVSCIAQGPKKVVCIVGMNKVCDDLDGANETRKKCSCSNKRHSEFNIKTTMIRKSGKML